MPFLLKLYTRSQFHKQHIKYRNIMKVHVNLTLLIDTEQSGWLVRWNTPNRRCSRGVRTIVGKICASRGFGVPVCCGYSSVCFIVLLWKGPRRCIVRTTTRSIRPSSRWKCACGWAQINRPSRGQCTCRWTRIWTLWIRASMLRGPSERAGRGRSRHCSTTGTPATRTAA